MSEPDKLLQVLGPACAKCAKLAENADAAAKDLAIDATIEKISDITKKRRKTHRVFQPVGADSGRGKWRRSGQGKAEQRDMGAW